MKKLFLILAIVCAAQAQTLVNVTGTDFRDAASHKLSGTCTPTPVSVTAPPWFIAPPSLPFSVVNGSYSIALLPGTYTVGCTVSYGAQRASISMNWLIGAGGPYRIDQVIITSPSGQQYTVLAQQLAPVTSDGQVLTLDHTQATGMKFSAPTGGTGSGVPYTGATQNLNLGIYNLYAAMIYVGDGTQSSALVLPGLAANGPNDTRIYGPDHPISSGCIIWPQGQSTAGQGAFDSNATATTTDGKTCRMFTWQTPLQKIAGGTAALNQTNLGTASLAGNACTTVYAVTAAGVVGTDVVIPTANSNIATITGYGALSTDGLAIYWTPVAGAINWIVCNKTSTVIAISNSTYPSINYLVVR